MKHRVVVWGTGNVGNPAAAGNATAAGRVVNAIPVVCAARPGILSTLDLPLITGRGLI